MTLSTVEASSGHRVIVHFCRCWAWAPFGHGVRLREAWDKRDLSLAGVRTCGPNGCRKAMGGDA